MRVKLYIVVAVAASFFLTFNLSAGQPAKPSRGTDILHWAVRKGMTNEDTNSNATAFVDLKQNRQGKADNQRLDLRIRNLQTNTPYQLWALVGAETNYAHAGDFTTDRKGHATLKYMQVGSSKGKGKGKNQLPADLDPISQLRGLAIGNVNTQAVFTADLLAPDKLQYLIKRSITESNVVANLHLKATTRVLQFRMYLWGLSPTNTYHLAVNDAVVSSSNSGLDGRLSFTNLPVSASQILEVYKLSVLDTGTNTVISTTLP